MSTQTATISHGRIRIHLNLCRHLGARSAKKTSGTHLEAGLGSQNPSRPDKERRKLKLYQHGNVSIPYGDYKSGKVNYWMCFWYRDGRRIRESRTSFAKLKARMEQIAVDIQNGRTAMSQFTEDQRAEYRAAKEISSRAGVSLLQLLSEAVESRRAAQSRTSIVPKTCPQIVDDLVAAKKADGAGLRWWEDLESRLGRFAEDFPGPLDNVSNEEIKLWLARLNLSKRTVNNYRTVLVQLVEFARERKYVREEWEGLRGIKPFKLVKGEEEIYTPEEIRSMLFTAEKYYPQHLPTLAIMGFSGCRHCELCDEGEVLDWKQVLFKTCQIHIKEGVAKSNTGRRYVPMPQNLMEWIEPYARPSGPVCVVSNLSNAFGRIAKKAGIEWKRNALRNGWISYRAAETKDLPQVAVEGGTSVGEIGENYLKELTAQDAAAWFAIRPTRPDVLPLFAHAGLK